MHPCCSYYMHTISFLNFLVCLCMKEKSVQICFVYHQFFHSIVKYLIVALLWIKLARETIAHCGSYTASCTEESCNSIAVLLRSACSSSSPQLEFRGRARLGLGLAIHVNVAIDFLPDP